MGGGGFALARAWPGGGRKSRGTEGGMWVSGEGWNGLGQNVHFTPP
jgi:hypothetical protein